MNLPPFLSALLAQTDAAVPSTAMLDRPWILAVLFVLGLVVSLGIGHVLARISRSPELASTLGMFVASIVLAVMVAVRWAPRDFSLAQLALVALAVVFSTALGKLLARRFRMPEYDWKLSLIVGSGLASAILIWCLAPPKWGVDLRGGVHIIGQLNEQELAPDEEPVTAQQIVPPLKERIDPSGVDEILIRARGDNQIEVVIPDATKAEAEDKWNLLVQAGHLVFRIVADVNAPESEHGRAIARARDTTLLRKRDVYDEDEEGTPDARPIAHWYELARVAGDSPEADRTPRGFPMPFKFMPSRNHLIRDAKTGRIINWNDVEIQYFEDPVDTSIAFAKWCDDRGIDEVEILMLEPDEKLDVQGDDLASVRFGYDDQSRPAVLFKMKGDGSKKMGRLTRRNLPNGGQYKLLGIVLDDRLNSAPRIENAIQSDGIIQGSFTPREVDELIAVLQSGKLEVALQENWISMDLVESSLGAELRKKGLLAIAISMPLVMGFMIFYYRFAGVIACLALLMNLVLITAVVLTIKVAITLTGLAGLVLTIGMSVDANVLIYERIREELNRGSALRMAIRNGFDRATTTIVDSNLTTLITALILYVIGTEQIRSFAVILILGILMSMFTAVFCSRVVFEIAERKRWISGLSMMQFVKPRTWDFVAKQRIAIIGSIVVILVGLGATFYRGEGLLDTDLRGGSTARTVFNQAPPIEEIRSRLTATDYVIPGTSQKIRFSVTAIQDSPNEFIIESSLPALPQEEGQSEPLRLDDILAEVFSGQLVMLQMDYDPNQIQPVKVVVGSMPQESPPSEEKSGADSMGPEPPHQPGDQSSKTFSPPSQRTGGAIAAWSSPALLWQDPQQKKSDPPAGDPNPPASADVSGTNNAQATDGQQPGDEGVPATEPAAAPQDAAPGIYESTVDVHFELPLNGAAVIGGLMRAAERLGDIPLSRSDINVTPKGIPDGTAKSQANDWTVVFRTSQPEDARRLLAQMKQSTDGEPYFPSVSGVGGQIAAESQWQAIVALMASLIGIIAYVWIRFQNVAFGLAAVVALIHDVLVMLGAIALSWWLRDVFLLDDFKISLPVVAAFLTIIGYSLNDTIVVFDRIREVRGKRTDLTADMLNVSISQTLSRTLLTAWTTFIVVLILFVLGGDAIHAFAFALVVGIIAGTYSSIFIASPALLWLMSRRVRRTVTAATQ